MWVLLTKHGFFILLFWYKIAKYFVILLVYWFVTFCCLVGLLYYHHFYEFDWKPMGGVWKHKSNNKWLLLWSVNVKEFKVLKIMTSWLFRGRKRLHCWWPQIRDSKNTGKKIDNRKTWHEVFEASRFLIIEICQTDTCIFGGTFDTKYLTHNYLPVFEAFSEYMNQCFHENSILSSRRIL